MKTDYGKIAYLKTEEIIKNIDNSKPINKVMVFAFENQFVTYNEFMFNHNLLSIEGSIINLSIDISFAIVPANDFLSDVYINNVLVYSSNKFNFDFSYVSSGNDNICVKFTGTDADMQISYIKFNYVGFINNSLSTDIMYFDDNASANMYYRNGKLTKYTSLQDFVSGYKYVNPTNEFYSANSIPTTTRKTGYCAIYFNEETGYLTFKNLGTNATYNLKQIKPDFAAFFPLSSSQYRIVYGINGKLYFFYMSRNGSTVSNDTEIVCLDNIKIKSIFPFNIVAGNTVNYFDFGVVSTDGNIYIFKYNDTLKNYSTKKLIGKGEYGSGYYDNNSVNVVTYNNGVASCKQFADRGLCNVVTTNKYYNCYRLFNIGGTMLCLNFNGISILNT